MRKHLLILFLAVFSVCATFAQTIRVTGKILDSQTKEPLIGASILVKGTTKATSATLTGTFKIDVPDGNSTIVISYIGYITKEIALDGKKDLGEINLVSNSSSMNEVTVTSDVAIDRKTPIAVSTVNAEYIEEKGAGQEFPELLKGTPGVMVTRAGGGYGDALIRVRGFESRNVALVINGIPVNDVESGAIYWSDWAGLADVTSSMQVQRGLGASKLAVPSLGGTIGIVTRTTDAVQGGTISESIGSYNDQRTSISLSTGLTPKGWAASFLLAKRSGDGNADGLYYTGYSYFFNLSKVLTPHQTLSFTVFGAAQSHGQRYNYFSIATYRNSPEGIRYNGDWGIYNGKIQSAEINYYNKPLAQLNHSWIINSTTSLSTSLYASIGDGAARYVQPYNLTTSQLPRTGDAYSPIDFQQIVKNNQANATGQSTTYFQNNVNNHQQYGLLSKLDKKIGPFDILAGADLRYYIANHYDQVQDLLGGQYMLDPYNADVNNPGYHEKVGDRFDVNYTTTVASEGVFLQSEYSKNDLSAFISLAADNTGNRKLDYFDYLYTDPARETKFVNFLGYQTKGGANYNLDSHNNVFVNVGYLQRAPLVSSVFLDFKNDVNTAAVPEKLLSYELGYGFKSALFTANINAFHTTYKDRSIAPKTYTDATTGDLITANLSGVNELHQGIETELKFRPTRAVTLRGMLTVGDYHYTDNAGPATVTNPTTGKYATVPEVYLKGLKVGDAAQTTAALGLDVNVLPQVKLGANYNYYANYTAYYDPTKLTTPGYVPYKLPNYNLLDMNLVFRFKFAGLDGSFIGNVYNVLNTHYLSDAYDSNAGAVSASGAIINPTPSSVGVYYGIGRQYTTTLKFKF